MTTPALDLLVRRWQLGSEAQPVVENLLKSIENGHSVLKLDAAEAALLKGSPALSQGQFPAPLVLLPGDLLQSWRLYKSEQRIAETLQSLASAKVGAVSPAVKKAQGALFRDPADAQSQAASLGLSRRLALITGGPGTGKTYCAARLLALLALGKPELRVALCAPTGKAAKRLGESVVKMAQDLPAPVAPLKPWLERTGSEAGTLHRLLGWRPGQDRCAYNADRPLPVDLVLVDEASMLDILLWNALLQALPPDASLIVLGDQRQLESIEPGRVLGSLVEAAGLGALKGCHIELKKNHRFDHKPGIAALAAAAADADSAAVLKALPAPPATGEGEVERVGSHELDAALDRVWPQVLALAQAREAGPALQALAQLRVLCALNQGPWGVEGLNRRIETRLMREGVAAHTRPLLVLVNEPQAGLFNGDLGVHLPGGSAYFGQPEAPKPFSLGALPRHETAWAMTVHRAQGSEYEQVLLVLPPEAHAIVGPEWLYTALTRCKARIVLAADEAALKAACLPREKRRSALGYWLAKELGA